MAAYVYFLASKPNGTLYVGVTTDLAQRVSQHKEGAYDGFTKKHAVHSLVYYIAYEDAASAIAAEKAIKKWRRTWKVELINQHNPAWRDLFEEICG